jgi:hypothetical protein
MYVGLGVAVHVFGAREISLSRLRILSLMISVEVVFSRLSRRVSFAAMIAPSVMGSNTVVRSERPAEPDRVGPASRGRLPVAGVNTPLQ